MPSAYGRSAPGPHSRVLDLCTGSGYLAVIAALAGAGGLLPDGARGRGPGDRLPR
ncbi:MAG: hypothetical protein ACR2ML_13820 [Solirubrobacteraceae bacterium]